MILRLVCSSVLLALWIPLGCSSSSGENSTDGGGTAGNSGSAGKGGDGGSGDTGEAGGGGDNAGGEPGTPSGSEGGAPALECAENDVSISDCETVGSVCTATDRCCRCIDFPSAPSCGSLWDCARPENNAEECPENPPTAGEPCAMLNLSCQYCQPDGPHYLFCGRIDVGSDEGEWNEGDGLSCNE